MNYDHAYHAGNFADVLKHAALCLCLDDLRKKEKPFFVLDTHGGQGRFDLAGPQAEKTGEAVDGIVRLIEAGPPSPSAGLDRYLATVRDLGMGADTLRAYPGSPLIISTFLRPTDRLVVAEKHPVHVRALKALLGARSNVRVEAGDGYGLLKALLPPPERRGLVLIDPPFEERGEFETLLRCLKQALKRWATGRYLVWFPVKDAAAVAVFLSRISAASPVPGLIVRLRVRSPAADAGLTETGLLVLNPPFALTTALPDLLPVLSAHLARGTGNGWSIDSFGAL